MGAIVFGLLGAMLCVLLLARYGPPPRVQRASDGRERMPLEALERLVIALLEASGLEVVDEERERGALRLLARSRDPLFPARTLVFVEAAPPGERVEPSRVLELKELVKADPGLSGLLITPYEIDREGLGGLDVPLELVDGPALRRLVAQRIPSQLDALARFRGVGTPIPEAEPA
jgi:hypothetical protein